MPGAGQDPAGDDGFEERRKGERRVKFRLSELEHIDIIVHACGYAITTWLLMLARLRGWIRRRRRP